MRTYWICLLAACLQFAGVATTFAHVRTHHGLAAAHRERHAADVHQRRHWSRTAPATVMRSYASTHEALGALAGHDRGGIVTINTAAGIPITAARSAASRFQGFIGDLVASGYRPRQIHCLAHSGHVGNSNHYWGGACDIDQSRHGRTAAPMYHVAALTSKWGLRDGCTFGDCGHVDIPRDGGRWGVNTSRRPG